jgi:hypothetical protein
MTPLRRKAQAPAPIVERGGGVVYATTDLSKGSRYVRRGDPVRRDDPMVLERPDLFEIRYLLSEEAKQN